MRSVLMLCATLACTLLHGAAPSDPAEEEPKNLIATHLAGTWRVKADVTAMLGGAERGDLGEVVVFKDDAMAVKSLSGEVAEFIKTHGRFMAGVMTKANKDFPFVLTQVSGSPCILWFRERDGDPMGNSEAFFVSLAPGETKERDLLFIGGDFDNQAFSAYNRSAQK